MALKCAVALLALAAVAAALTDSEQEVLDKLLNKQANEVRVKRAARKNRPQIMTKDNHVFITSSDVEQNVTDLLSTKTAEPRFKEVERRAEKNVVDLLDANNDVLTELKTSSVAQTNALEGQVKSLDAGFSMIASLLSASANETAKANAKVQQFQEAQALAQSGGGTKTKTGGPAFNPFTASVSALGGDSVRIMFPKTAELVADPTVKVYQCKFTYLKNGKLDAKKFRLSVGVAADTERTFACMVPAWGEGGKMPDEAEFTTNLQVLENGRLMPEPSGGQVIKWIPQTPTFKFQNVPSQLSGPPGKKKAFSIDLEVLYDYGEAGYKDVELSYSTPSASSKIVTDVKFTGNTGLSSRKIEFQVNHPKSAKKEAQYHIDVTITSKKYKLTSKQRLTINYKGVTGFGAGAQEGVLTEVQVKALKTKIGDNTDREYKLCYSSKLHGWSTAQFHARCDGTHDWLVVHKRGSNKRVFGGWAGLKKFGKGSYNRNSGNRYLYGNTRGQSWMWRINPNNGNVEYAEKHWHSYMVYMRGSYFFTFGGGHDLNPRDDGYTYSNMDHDYNSPHGYNSGGARSWLAGQYSWNGKNEKDLIETYHTEA